jgi:pSer/pThr/pTyr-binding forkhead associated (FHA) protein
MAESPRVQLSLKGRLLSEVAFIGPQLRIGRMRENDVVVNNLAVSRFHAVLKREQDQFVLEDLGSENGTELNGARISGSVTLAPGDVIQLGKYELRLVMQAGLPLARAPKSKPSDAWDASQTFLALDGKPGPAASAAKPAISPSPLATPSGALGDARPATPTLSPLPAPKAHVAADLPADDLSLPVIDGIELASEPAPMATASPDPGGAFAFGEEDLGAIEAPDPSARPAGTEGDAPLAPSPEHTSLFDFGAPDAAAEAPEIEPSADEIRADFAGEAEDLAPSAPAATPSRAAQQARVYAGLIVQRDGKLHLLRAWEQGELCAGRAPDCDIVLADAGVSRRHAVFMCSGERYAVRDLGSVNGVYVNGQRSKQHELAVGDVVRIESFELTFVLDHSPIGSEVSAPAAVPAASQETSRATQFSLDALPRESEESLELEPIAADPGAPEVALPSDLDPADGFEILPPADDPLGADAQTAEPVAGLPESDLVGDVDLDEDEKKEEAERAMLAALPAGLRGVRLQLALDASALSPRAREALATLAEEGVALSARISFERE